ncbi:MAG: YdcF family protein [Clostridia bacterium]|nr:YdcF family protein [Clostridia bacterium]
MKRFLEEIKAFFHKYGKPIKNSFIFIGFVIALVFLFVLIININVVENTNDNIYSVDELIKLDDDFDCILILGAGIRRDGTPTPMLRDRLIAGLEAYKHLKTVPILVSGDSERPDYCETVTMKNMLLENDVLDELIISDGYGLSTYESIWRAKNVYGYNKILIVSQKYHLHRAIYIANELGMVAYGVDGALTTYGKQPLYSFREYLARIKDTIYAEMRPEPKYTNKWEEIYE